MQDGQTGDLATIRTEIKAWERAFKAEHGRDPTIEEIKALPHIAEKYKLYKRLSKAAASQKRDSSGSQSQAHVRSKGPPSTPPRRSASVKSTAPLAGFNPFSPMKKRITTVSDASQDPLSFVRISSGSKAGTKTVAQHIDNPFATPTKSKLSGSKARKPRTPSASPPPADADDVFPPITDAGAEFFRDNSTDCETHITARAATPGSPAHAHALARARKRLRGEPVSPSPVKSKRTKREESEQGLSLMLDERIFSTRKDAKDDERREREGGDEKEYHEEGESFIAESPVKPARTADGKEFKLLFDEVRISGMASTGAGRAKRKHNSAEGKNKKITDYANGVAKADKAKATTPSFSTSQRKPFHKTKIFFDGGARSQTEVNDLDLFAAGPSLPSSSSTHVLPRLSKKRVRPASETLLDQNVAVEDAPAGESMDMQVDPSAQSHGPPSESETKEEKEPLSFLPPSPPPMDSTGYGSGYGAGKYNKHSSNPSKAMAGSKGKNKQQAKEKEKSTNSRKKPRLSSKGNTVEEAIEDEADESSEGLDVEKEGKVRVVDHTRRLHNAAGDMHKNPPLTADHDVTDLADDKDLILRLSSQNTLPHRRSPSPSASAVSKSETLVANLPEYLQRLLSLSVAPSSVQESKKEEEHIIEGLFYGRKRGYEGGLIWGAGEGEKGDVKGGLEGDLNVSEEVGKEEGLESRGGTEAGEDWEGEGLLWEVGELDSVISK